MNAEGERVHNRIVGSFMCGLCYDTYCEHHDRVRNRDFLTYQKIQVGTTEEGLQVWCLRHGVNICLVDFEGESHPANWKKSLTESVTPLSVLSESSPARIGPKFNRQSTPDDPPLLPKFIRCSGCDSYPCKETSWACGDKKNCSQGVANGFFGHEPESENPEDVESWNDSVAHASRDADEGWPYD